MTADGSPRDPERAAARDPRSAPPAGRWRQVQRVVDGALDLPPEARAAHLDAVCGTDAALRESAARLLDACERADHAGGLLAAPAAAFAAPMLADLAVKDAEDARASGAALADELRTALSGRYTVDRELGRGGMATVYLAWDVRHDRAVAVKVLQRALVPAAGVTRFLQEIRVAARLTHPHIVPLYDSGESDGLLFYVMPYVEGETLRAWLARAGALPLPDAERVLRELADALAYAHSRGVMHRDLKPENVLISGGHAVVTDFGVAKALAAATTTETDAPPSASALTAAGVVLGTPAYMAPEQAAGDPHVDHRADLYALGVIAYEALAGAHPFGGRPLRAIVTAHLTEVPAPLAARRADAPPALAALVMRLLEKPPDARPPSADAVLQELDAATAADAAAGVVARRPATDERERRAGRRRRAMLAAGGAVALVAALATGAVVGARRPAPAPARAAASGVAGGGATKSVAVLPLVNVGGDTGDAYFATGMTDEVTGALARLPGLRVASRSAASLVDTRQPVDVRDAGRRLHVGAVLAGRVRRQGTRLRLAVELVDVADGTQLWSGTYTRDVEDAFRVQDEVARAIASALSVRLAAGASPARPGTESAEAHDLVLRARYLSNLYTGASLRRAIALYEQALALDSTYAAAWSGLGEAWIRMADDFVPAREALPHIRVAVARALALDSTLADAHAQRASLLGYYDRDYGAADREYVRALALDSTLSGASADYANILAATGSPDSAAAVLARALRIDPLSPYLGYYAPLSFIYLGRMADARAACGAASDVSPALGHRCRSQLLFADGQYAALVDTLRAEAEPSAVTHSHLAAALARLGRAAAARREAALVEAAARERYLDERVPAQMYAAMGDPDRALAWLERGLASNAAILAYMNVDNRLAPLRPDPRFQALLRRARLH